MIDLENSVREKPYRIVFTEGKDLRMIKAAYLLKQRTNLMPLLYGNTKEITDVAKSQHIDLSDLQILDPEDFTMHEAMIRRIIELRKGKTDWQSASAWIQTDAYFCTMYVEMGFADGLLGGSTNTTAATLRPIMQLIKTSHGNSIVSSCFLMIKENRQYLFADCSLNIDPSVDEIVEITLQSAHTAKSFGLEPKVALLSYSTKGSGKGCDVDKMREATIRLQRMFLDFSLDGELQADCALNAKTAALKAKNSNIKGDANVLIFPNLNAGNIGYKLVANLGGYEAFGPILQGVRLPMNDLSRSASVEEIYQMALITALQKMHMA